jgi:hypothetical protein
MSPSMKVGSEVRHADFESIGTVTEIFIGGAEVSADFDIAGFCEIRAHQQPDFEN